MARQNVYMKEKTLEGIRKIVDERRDEGASPADANISSVCAEMLEIGLRVTEQIKKKESKKNDGENGLSKEELCQRQILDECVKSRLAVQNILQMMFDLEEIKSDSRYNFREIVEKCKKQNVEIVDKHFPNELDG